MACSWCSREAPGLSRASNSVSLILLVRRLIPQIGMAAAEVQVSPNVGFQRAQLFLVLIFWVVGYTWNRMLLIVWAGVWSGCVRCMHLNDAAWRFILDRAQCCSTVGVDVLRVSPHASKLLEFGELMQRQQVLSPCRCCIRYLCDWLTEVIKGVPAFCRAHPHW